MSLPVCPANGSLYTAPPFPRSGPSEPGSPFVTGTMKALRLPIAYQQSLILFASAAHAILLLCVRRGAPEGSKVPSRPGPWMPAARLSGCLVWTPMGSLRSPGDPSCAFAPFLDPGRSICPCHGGHIGAAPATHTAKASATADFGAHSRSFGTCSPTLRVSCCHSRARLASGWWLAFAGRASNPLDRVERFQIVDGRPPFLFS
jgi:hypothetical protein